MTEKEMWSEFCEENNYDINTPHEAWPFCGGGAFADELAALVLEGKKLLQPVPLSLTRQKENPFQLPVVIA